MALNVELFRDVHGPAKTEQNEHLKSLEAYFHVRRENVALVTVMPNFCLDEDMTFLMQRILKEKGKGLRVYRGLLVELRPNYTMKLSDLCFLYPQLCKLRGYVELEPNADLEEIKARIQQICELEINDLIEDKQTEESFAISPLYNSIGLYRSHSSNEEWGTSRESNVLGYDLSCDKYLMHFLIHLLEQEINVTDFHKRLMTTKVGSTEQTPLNMANDAAKGAIEFLTGKDEDECKWLTDFGTNWMYKNAQNYFYFNNCISLLALNKRPTVLQTAQVAGVQLYKTTLTNSHKYCFAWPTDTGFLEGYHSDSSLNVQQRERIRETFVWDRDRINFNTSLMQQVNKINTSEWKTIESKLQVIPESFYRVIFCRLSTHAVYARLDAKTLLSLVPGEREALVDFPIDKEHIVLDTIIKDYARVERFAKIFNPLYYDKEKNTLKIPKGIAEIILK